MLCSFGSFSMICQRSCTDLEKSLPSVEYGITIGRLVLALGVLWRKVSWEWRRALEILQVMISK